MNNLSWLLYWANVLPGLATLLAFLSVTVGILLSIVCFVLLAEDEAPFTKTVKWAYFTIGVMLLVATLIPSEKTFYLIAASEVGEDVLQSPEASKIRKLINTKLDEALQEENGAKEDE